MFSNMKFILWVLILGSQTVLPIGGARMVLNHEQTDARYAQPVHLGYHAMHE